ncbi:MAG TPA: glycosyltransferase family 2 protein [Verrucomicrobiae bacterium]|jgi:glycosyltransferase involved in cell wall biosynthesis|nr:glycosyltransferase family 2 protein [Verrucomicrobiae bacterium]
MAINFSISIIICTRNRASSLRQTLAALRKVRILAGHRAEVIVVDNGSTDDTACVAQTAGLKNMEAVYLFEPRKGKSNALNSGLAVARGETLVFTDDDVVPSEDWIEQILLCFDKTRCDALVGKITLAPHLERPWIKDLEKDYLAITDFESGRAIHWIGANGAFQRRCMQRVRQFDPELGPGALGLAEDTLFGFQLVEAGFRIEYAAGAGVVHQPDKSRLSRGAWLEAAQAQARSDAYVRYHWEHLNVKGPILKWMWLLMKLNLRSKVQASSPPGAEGCARWEWSYLHDLTFQRQYCIERRRPRNYARRGLEKLNVPAGFAITQAAPAGYYEHSSI